MADLGGEHGAGDGLIVYTVGHSTHPAAGFVDLLRAHGVQRIADVRTIAKSRHNPQFGEEALAATLRDAGIGYVRMKELGGLRHTTKASVNGAWRNASFRGYADYMQTGAFAEGIDRLRTAAAEKPTAVMCAEAVPWRCHRSLIGDALLVRGDTVLDIMSPTQVTPHTLTSFAVVDGLTITYPPVD
ncbi:DUF488 domain-containing protein [Tomitella fengzijianii]|uniref:DUF488 domain-containing protein n=2 Tax=Tomitella fengzijianii TaxID=2597660 RepID=A0A516X7A6_9ACTN|nr:DUF488 domain-containing protein [Tomitella fengzijianii]